MAKLKQLRITKDDLVQSLLDSYKDLQKKYSEWTLKALNNGEESLAKEYLITATVYKNVINDLKSLLK